MKKASKKIFCLVVLFAMAFSYFMPITRVFADGEYVIYFSVSGNHTMENVDGHLRIDGQFVDLKNANDESKTIGTVECSSNVCTITVNDGTAGKLNYNSDKKFTLFMQGHEMDINHVFSANENMAVQDYVEPHQGGEEQINEPHFDGNAYVVWSCKTGGICFHHFDDIPNFDDGKSTFYSASDIKDDRTNESFDVAAQYKGWATDSRFDAWVSAYKIYKNIQGEIDWSTVNPEDMLGHPIDMREYEDMAIKAGECTTQDTSEDDFHACVDSYVASLGIWSSRVQLQPVGEPNANNSYVSYGDRNFKVVIYNENYKGITMGDLSSLNYYPSSWSNPFIMRDQFDISGTTKEKPTAIDSILLEDTVKIRPLNYNSFAIASIEALDVPEDAVEIIKDSNGDFRLIFSSNFYDNVIFKVTDTKGEKSYLQVKRYTIDGWIRFVDNHPVLTADFYFDNTKEYTDFDITAKIVYRDGTTRNVDLTASYGIDDGMGNITPAYEVNEELYGGKGLKKSTFEFPLEDGEDRNIRLVYLNAEYKGSTTTNYAGAYVGSGEGVLANIYQGEDE